MDSKLKLKNQLCFPIYLCSKEIIKRYGKYLKELDLTYTQYIVMMYFWEMKTSNVKELSQTLLLDSSTLTPLLKKLEYKGYLKRIRDVNDERNLILSLTRLGISLKEKAKCIPSLMEKCINLTKDEEKILYSLVYKVLNNVEEDMTND